MAVFRQNGMRLTGPKDMHFSIDIRFDSRGRRGGGLVDVPQAFLTPGDAEVRAMFWNLEGTTGAESSAGRVFKAALPLEAATPEYSWENRATGAER